jgi:predicted RNase H-like nuclease (RuvC/YqgF family)
MDTSTIAKILASKQEERMTIAAKLIELDQEIGELESTLKVLAKYSEAIRSKRASASEGGESAVNMVRRSHTKREQILSSALHEITEKQPILTEVLLEMIEKRGVNISGEGKKGKLANLSAYLSRAKEELGIMPSRQGWMRATKEESPVLTGLPGI